MGVPWSEGLSKEQVAQVLGLVQELKTMNSWCSCDELTDWWHVEPYAYCGVCKTNECDNDHYHCTVCTKVTQVG